MAYQTETIPMTLSNLQGHWPTARLFKCDFSYSCPSRSPYVVGELLVKSTRWQTASILKTVKLLYFSIG